MNNLYKEQKVQSMANGVFSTSVWGSKLTAVPSLTVQWVMVQPVPVGLNHLGLVISERSNGAQWG